MTTGGARAYLRETFGFPPWNDLATILVGFNLAAP